MVAAHVVLLCFSFSFSFFGGGVPSFLRHTHICVEALLGGIRSLLESNNYFGLEPEQVTILLQEKVAALARSDALLSMEGRYKAGTCWYFGLGAVKWLALP